MRIAINGMGIAGPTLAWWLQRYGHEPVLFEKSPVLRTGGYLIDFWGIGYDVAEKMGLLPSLHEKGYLIESLRNVDGRGKLASRLDVSGLRKLAQGRLVSIARGDLAEAIYRASDGVQTRLNCSITGITQHADRVLVQLSDGAADEFDLVVGADGLHSHIRSLTFGPESMFERHLGCHVAALHLPNYQPRDELTSVNYTVPKRMVGRVALRNDATLFLFVFRSELIQPLSPDAHPREILRHVFGDMQWEVPCILEQLDRVGEIYFDRVSQIRMNRWTNGRIALIGDAAACVSLLAGEGTGLAMAEAYILAGEIHRATGDHQAAFRKYETSLQPFLTSKQKSALRMINFFAPKTRFHLLLRDLGLKAASIPLIGKTLLGGVIQDDIQLKNYDD
jgi:2-polyprenyl-6-methoxyphenol hydroxylase-like FAD-dependent oxidoreductase